jgi:chemotaxis protein methyltransferase CheR
LIRSDDSPGSFDTISRNINQTDRRWAVIRRNGYSLKHIRFEGKPANRRHNPQISGSKLNEGSVRPIQSAEDPMPLNEFAARVLESAGLPSQAYRATPINRRLAACMRTLKAGSLAEAHHLLMQYPGLSEKAIDSLLIGSTEFARDAPVFMALREIIAADLAIHEKPIRIWSAGCSNGAELYSMAMLLAEAGLLQCSTLIGTDCRSAAIREAQAGLYHESSIRSMDASLRRKYIQDTGKQWCVTKSLHAQTQWRVKNLLAGCEKGPWDIILWRNMAIYLKHVSAHQVWEAMIKELPIGGRVVVGKAERPPSSLGLTCISPCIYQLQRPRTKAATVLRR